MSTLQNGDSFLVQRTDSQSGISTNYQVSQENLMANLADDDLLLVQRTSAGISTNYSITGSALKEDLGGVGGLIANPVEVLTPLDGSGLSGDISYYPETSAVTNASPVQSVHDLGSNFIQVGNAYFQTGSYSNLYDTYVSTSYGITGMSASDPGQLLYIRFSNDYDGTTSVFKSGAAVDFRIYSISTTPIHVELHYNDGTVEYSNTANGHSHLVFTTKPKPLSLGIIKPVSGSVNGCEIKIAMMWIGQPLPDPYDPNIINTAKFSLEGPTVLTLTNDKVFNSSDDTEMSTVDQVLTEGTVVDGEGGPPIPTTPVFSTTLYQTNGSNRSITTGIDNTEKSLLWFKHRDTAYNNVLVDSMRGTDQILTTNNDGGNYYSQDVTSLTETGVNLSNGTGWINHSDYKNVVLWNFRAMPNFFDIVTWTGNDSVREIPHNLGSKPGFIIIKRYDGIEDWTCYHRSLPGGSGAASRWVQLNGTGGTNGGSWFMNNTEPTSTHFTVASHGRVNNTNWNYVAYVFAHNEDTSGGNIKCGGYSGTGSPGTTIDLGFEPGFFMVKNITSGGDWHIVDAERGMPASGDAPYLEANTSDNEFGKNIQINATSTGVVINEFNDAKSNQSSNDYIYIAIAKDAGIPDGLPATGILAADADASTPSITLTGVTGTWTSGMTAVGRTELTKYAPGPDEITFTSQNAGTTPFNGTDATLAFRRWTLESRASAGDPWVVVDTYEDYDIVASQDGATPWSSNKPTLSPNTMYRVKVAYISTNADPVESVYNTFTTGSN